MPQEQNDNVSTNVFMQLTPHVLLAEDEPNFRRLLQVRLEKAGFLVTPVNHGVEAIEQLSQKNFQLVVSDMMMPEMDGFELLTHIRRSTEWNKLPFIFLSAKSDTNPWDEGRASETAWFIDRSAIPANMGNLGINTIYLFKLSAPKRLIEVVQSVLNQNAL